VTRTAVYNLTGSLQEQVGLAVSRPGSTGTSATDLVGSASGLSLASILQSLPYLMPLREMKMQSSSSKEAAAHDCAVEGVPWAGEGRPAWTPADADRQSAKARMLKLARTLEAEVIPRLVKAHRQPAQAERGATVHGVRLSSAEIEAFAQLVMDDDDAKVVRAVAAMRRKGLSVESLFVDVFAPAARHLGALWDEDRCDFSAVTVGLGRLQRLLRELSPAFGSEVEHPAQGRRILFTQPDEEQHSFGLSMVAEFFRRDGWDVCGGVAGSRVDAATAVAADWFDVVGFSVGSETRLAWLVKRIAQVRKASRNRRVVVLVGGPIFTLHPQWSDRTGADAVVAQGEHGPRIADSLLAGQHKAEQSTVRPA
jgi:methanogenic corrinoid protein MtbC1